MPARKRALLPAQLARTILRLPRSAAHEFRSITPSMPRFARGAAWFFIVISLLNVAWIVALKWNDPAGVASIYQTTVGEETYRAWALAYDGLPGLMGALAQFVIVSFAAAMSSLGRGRVRRAGHGILIAWSALWMINLLRLASIDMRPDSVMQAAMFSMLFICTVARASMKARPTPGNAASIPPAAAPFQQAAEQHSQRAGRDAWLSTATRRGAAGCRAFLRAVREPAGESTAAESPADAGEASSPSHASLRSTRVAVDWLRSQGVMSHSPTKPQPQCRTSDSGIAA